MSWDGGGGAGRWPVVMARGRISDRASRLRRRGPIPLRLPAAPPNQPTTFHTNTCTDEVFSVIGDLGTQTSRFGYAGEDCPKAVFPSVRPVDWYGRLMDDTHSRSP